MDEVRPALFVAQVLFDYNAQAPEEISLKEGHFCHIIEVNDAGWWLVREANLPSGSIPRSGWAPSNFMRQLAADELGLLVGLQPTTPISLAPKSAPASAVRLCGKCGQDIAGSFALADGKSFHVDCFTCGVCNAGLAGGHYHMKDGVAYCEGDYFERFSETCSACNRPIRGAVVNALGRQWHPEHFSCARCHNSMAGGEFFIGPDQQAYCASDYRALYGVHCAVCQSYIDGPAFEIEGKSYHVACFRCSEDQVPISETDPFHVHEGRVYCVSHFQERFLQRCSACQKPLWGQFVQVLTKTYHSECFKCSSCGCALSSGQFHASDQDEFVCGSCANGKRAPKNNERIAPVNIEPAAPQKIVRANSESGEKKMNYAMETSNGKIRMKAADLIGKDRQLPEAIDRLHKEYYLCEEEFQALLGMGREQFAALKPWKQQQLKQQVGLF